MNLKQRLLTYWEENNLQDWLESGPGNCYSPSYEFNKELCEAALPYNVAFHVKFVTLGVERWCYVEACGFVIVSPFRVDA